MEPTLSTQQAADTVAAEAKAPRVTEESIKEKIGHVEYKSLGVLTVCVITMKNGFMVVGKSAPASPANFNEEVGKRYAYDDAFKQLWQFEGYLLRDKLAQPATPAADPSVIPQDVTPPGEERVL